MYQIFNNGQGYRFSSDYSVAGDYSHGTLENALQHKRMMEDIANEIVNKALKQYSEALETKLVEMQKEAYRQAIDDFLSAIEYDITSVVSLGIEGCNEIINDSKTQKYISDHIMQEIKKRLSDKSFKK